MSGVEIVSALLIASPALLAAVPTDRIMAGGLPEGVQLPALLITSISDVDWHGLAGSASRTTERVQVTVHADNYEQQTVIAALVKRACDGFVGDLGSIPARSVTVVAAGKGPDFRDDQASIWMTSVDFRVGFRPL